MKRILRFWRRNIRIDNFSLLLREHALELIQLINNLFDLGLPLAL